MNTNVFRFQFESSVPLDEAELTLHLAVYATEGLFGEARARLEVSYRLDEPGHAILLDSGTEVGTSLARIFAQLCMREFGEEAFHVRSIEAANTAGAEPNGRAA